LITWLAWGTRWERSILGNLAFGRDTFSRSECVGWARGQFFPMELVDPRQMVGDIVHFGGENGKFTFS
jgi:hypothetical protein